MHAPLNSTIQVHCASVLAGSLTSGLAAMLTGTLCFLQAFWPTGRELTTNAKPLLVPVLELLAIRTCTKPGYAAAARQSFQIDIIHMTLSL